MKGTRVVGLALVVLALIWLGRQTGLQVVQAAASAQELTPFPTPTPGPDGRILYIVQPGDTLWRVAAISGVSVEELRTLNNLAPEQNIVPGQTLLLGYAAPPEATPTPGPTPTPRPGEGTICVLLYEDRNGNARYEEDSEPLLAGGAISLTNRAGSVSQTGETNGDEAVCFKKIPAGDYNLSLAVPQGYNPTTALNLALTLVAGDTLYATFGAQAAAPEAAPAEPTPPRRSPLLGLVGVVLIVLGLGLAWYARRATRLPG